MAKPTGEDRIDVDQMAKYLPITEDLERKIDEEYNDNILWRNIRQKAKTNVGLQDLLTQVEVYYRLLENEQKEK